jgi:hypothetical protein
MARYIPPTEAGEPALGKVEIGANDFDDSGMSSRLRRVLPTGGSRFEPLRDVFRLVAHRRADF